MFKNKREFAQALLDGRKFKIRHPGSGILDSDIIKFDEEHTNPFRYGDDILNGSWSDYRNLYEVIVPFKPNRGDMILVSNENVPLKVEREFIMMYDNKWVCKIPNESNRLFAWRSAEAI